MSQEKKNLTREQISIAKLNRVFARSKIHVILFVVSILLFLLLSSALISRKTVVFLLSYPWLLFILKIANYAVFVPQIVLLILIWMDLSDLSRNAYKRDCGIVSEFEEELYDLFRVTHVYLILHIIPITTLYFIFKFSKTCRKTKEIWENESDGAAFQNE